MERTKFCKQGSRETIADRLEISQVVASSRFDAQLGLSAAAVVFLGKKLYSHCLSHPAVNPGTYCIVYNQGTAEKKKQLSIADAVIPVKNQKKNYCL